MKAMTEPRVVHTRSFTVQQISALDAALATQDWMPRPEVLSVFWEALPKMGAPARAFGVLCAMCEMEGMIQVAWTSLVDGRYPHSLADDEVVEVYDRQGKQVLKSKVRDISFETFVKFGPGYFWRRELSRLFQQQAWSLSATTFAELAEIERDSQWQRKAPRIWKILETVTLWKGYQPQIPRLWTVGEGTIHETCFAVVDLLNQDVANREKKYPLGGEPIPAFDNTTYRIVSRFGKRVARKRFDAFSEEELKRYFVHHFWLPEYPVNTEV